MATQPTTGLTYTDLQRFPDDGLRREIMEGELFVAPSPWGRHQDAVTALVVALALHAREAGGKVYPASRDVYLSETSVVQPDVLFVRADHLDRAEEPFVRGAPDLVVEVSSPSSRGEDLGRKRDLYERFGVPEYWFVDLERDEVVVFALRDGAYGEGRRLVRGDAGRSSALAGFEVPVDEILGR